MGSQLQNIATHTGLLSLQFSSIEVVLKGLEDLNCCHTTSDQEILWRSPSCLMQPGRVAHKDKWFRVTASQLDVVAFKFLGAIFAMLVQVLSLPPSAFCGGPD
jgi:hypothetical protein